MSLRDSLETTFRTESDGVIERLSRRFRSLNRHQCEDLVSLAFTQALEACDKPGFQLQNSWLAWLQTCAKNRALDFLRRHEEQSLDAMLSAGALSPRLHELTPSRVLMQEEANSRRKVILSDLLRDYVKYTEQRGMFEQRQVFERILRGQQPGEIATEMALKPQSIYDHRRRAFERIREQVAQPDVHGSVLGLGDNVMAPNALMVPDRLSGILQLVIDELGALCPSEAQLQAYQVAPTSDDVADVRYHVEEARWYDHRPWPRLGCPQCQL